MQGGMREVHAAGQVPRAGSASGSRSRRLAGLRDALALLAMAVCLALLVRTFVMGDNREESHDSRRFGTIPRDDIEGPAILLYWSLAGPQPSSGAGRGLALLPERIRWDRIGARVR